MLTQDCKVEAYDLNLCHRVNLLILNTPTFNYEYRPATPTYSHHTSTCKFLSARF